MPLINLHPFLLFPLPVQWRTHFEHWIEESASESLPHPKDYLGPWIVGKEALKEQVLFPTSYFSSNIKHGWKIITVLLILIHDLDLVVEAIT